MIPIVEKHHYPFMGGMGFGMAMVAFSVFDYLAFILFNENLKSGTGNRYDQLLATSFFDYGPTISHDIFYNILRNGLVHQLFPKNVTIVAKLDSTKLLTRNTATSSCDLDALFLLRETLKGYRNIIHHVQHCSPSDLASYEANLMKLIQNDMSEFNRIIGSKTF